MTRAAARGRPPHFRSLVDHAVEGIFRASSSGRFVYANAALAKLLGYDSPEELIESIEIGRDLYVDPGERAAALERLLRDGQVSAHEVRLRRKDGSVVWGLVSSRVVDDGGELYSEGTVLDVTERREERARLDMHLEVSRTLAAAPDLAAAAPALLAAVCRATGWELGALWERGQGGSMLCCLGLWHRPDLELATLVEATRKARFSLGMGLPGAVWESREPRFEPDVGGWSGYSRAAQAVAAGLRSGFALPMVHAGNVEGVLDFLSSDPTPPKQRLVEALASIAGQIAQQVVRTRAQEQVRQAQKLEAVGLFAAGVAHDVNNLLHAIELETSLIAKAAGLPPAVGEVATRIEEACGRVAQLTRQLLAFSRRQAMAPARLDLREVVSELRPMLERIAGATVAIEVERPPAAPLVHGDRGMLEQVLLNLTINARDAMPRGGRLRIGLAPVSFGPSAREPRRAGDFVRWEVEDDGEGIAPALVTRIFDPFFTTRSPSGGSGLGLAIAFGIVQQHEGWIEVESTVGVGTTFRVYLPQSSALPID